MRFVGVRTNFKVQTLFKLIFLILKHEKEFQIRTFKRHMFRCGILRLQLSHTLSPFSLVILETFNENPVVLVVDLTFPGSTNCINFVFKAHFFNIYDLWLNNAGNRVTSGSNCSGSNYLLHY